MHRISAILLALLFIFIGAVWATWITVSAHNLGVLSVIVGLVVIVIELWVWQPWVRA